MATHDAGSQTLAHTVNEEMLDDVLTSLWPQHSCQGTADRVLRMWSEMTVGYRMNPATILSKQFDEHGTDELIVCSGIPFTSLCEHHLMPFTGVAAVGYLPSNGSVVGLSKLARLVDCYAQRLQLQERMTRQIAEAMILYLDPQATGVVIRAEHSCLSCRGAKKVGARFTTSAMLGRLRTDDKMRAEFFAIING